MSTRTRELQRLLYGFRTLAAQAHAAAAETGDARYVRMAGRPERNAAEVAMALRRRPKHRGREGRT